MVEYLRGDSTLQQAIAGYQAATRQYARRQLTWFRADSRIRWLDALDDRVAAASASIAAWLTSASSGVRSD
jgi:tRNA dimethylallyltransferase